MWLQRVSEGWRNVLPLDGTNLGENSLPEPSLLVEEEVPENLGCEWRVLHLFELHGVRCPTGHYSTQLKGGWQKMMPW